MRYWAWLVYQWLCRRWYPIVDWCHARFTHLPDLPCCECAETPAPECKLVGIEGLMVKCMVCGGNSTDRYPWLVGEWVRCDRASSGVETAGY